MSCLGWAKEVPRINPQVMPSIKLQQVKNFEKLLQYLETELGWPVEGREIDDIAFPFDLEADLGLDKKEVAKVRHVYRLKKMHKKQPFGIFFVDFEGKKMPVSVLKRILRTLALRRRANAKAADQLAWDVEDLIFISAVGEEKDASREISFAHFRKEPDNRHVLKVLAWDGGDTPLKMDHLDEVLHENLRFPDDVSDVEAWRKSWTAAFRTGVRQNIRRSEELAQALAALAMRINKEALSLIKKESANGPLKTLHAGFKDALIHDLTEEAFTDCYAQTITYGLLTAAITKVNQAGVKDLTSTSVLEMVPSTNPFLKDILSSFLEAGGRGQKGIDFDDLGVQDVIDLLRAESTDLPNILRDFGNLTQDEDPVIHFYETFLKIYNKDERVKRGAFYTPRPVVSYIVRSVDEVLRKEFGLEDGLADTTTWGEMIKRNPAIKLPPLTDTPGEKKTIKETEPFVQILDPATGTATFLVEVINVIEKTVKAKAWAKLKKGAYEHDQHSKREEVLKAWNEYVPDHLLKRLHAYELMMAPYVIAHMKVGLKLAETGYRFVTEERARIYLTNALEPAKDYKDRLNFDIPALAIEAKQVNEVKTNKRFTVIIGNPPYKGHSSNKGEWISELVDKYYYVGEEPLNERTSKWLQDDYVKFIRFAEYMQSTAGAGLTAYITNHSYIDNPTFRGMRYHLSQSYRGVTIIDLHGNTTKREIAPDGTPDDNVFAIKQGVSIGFFVKQNSEQVMHGEVWGSAEKKYEWLKINTLEQTKTSAASCGSPFYMFRPENSSYKEEYEAGMSVTEIFNIHAPGFVTSRDHWVIGFSDIEVSERMGKFLDKKITDDELRRIMFGDRKEGKYKPGDTREWKLEESRIKVQKDPSHRSRIIDCLYRPFDIRKIYWTPWMVDWHRPSTSGHIVGHENLTLNVGRAGQVIGPGEWNIVHCSRTVADFNLFRRGGNGVFPLYLYDSDKNTGLDFGETRALNLSHEFLTRLAQSIGRSSERSGLPKGISVEQVFYYIYAILNAKTYRKRFKEFLKSDYPRIPFPRGIEIFKEISSAGKVLVECHTLSASMLNPKDVKYVGSPSVKVDKVNWDNGTAWIDKRKSAGFSGITSDIWAYQVGGYHVCEKWLESRQGLQLLASDIEHFLSVTQAIKLSISTQATLDEYIASNGGWPKAF